MIYLEQPLIFMSYFVVHISIFNFYDISALSPAVVNPVLQGINRENHKHKQKVFQSDLTLGHIPEVAFFQ